MSFLCRCVFYLQFCLKLCFDSAASHLNVTKIEKWMYYTMHICILLQVKDYSLCYFIYLNEHILTFILLLSS